jgi:hypothetical protein
MSDLRHASSLITKFRGASLGKTFAGVERRLVGMKAGDAVTTFSELGIGAEVLLAALLVKKHSSQINEIVHALGILLALPSILEKGERVESLSLGAGNTGKGFDLETNRRIAEFTFIQWQGGPEVIRQNKIFKDFFFLAEAETDKIRELYTIGTERPMKFFNSGRRLANILAGNAKLGAAFRRKYPKTFDQVREYYGSKKEVVAIMDLHEHLPVLREE